MSHNGFCIYLDVETLTSVNIGGFGYVGRQSDVISFLPEYLIGVVKPIACYESARLPISEIPFCQSNA